MSYIIFSKNNCPQCVTAIHTLESASVEFEVLKMDQPGVMDKMFEQIKLTNTPDFVPRSAPVVFKREGDDLTVFQTIYDFQNDILGI